MERNKKVSLIIILICLLIIVNRIITGCVVFKASVEGNSMQPTYLSGEHILVNKLGSVKRGCVVVAKRPSEDRYIIKRCVAIPYDTVKVEDSLVYVNGEPIVDDYSIGETACGVLGKEVKLGKGEYILLGDNREVSRDSREYGVVYKKDILGVVLFKK